MPPQTPAEPLLIVPSQAVDDCAVVCLAMYVGVTYREALRFVGVRHRARLGQPGWPGLTDRQILYVLRQLGLPCRLSSVIDFENDYGIVRFPEHAAILKRGQIIDPGDPGAVWDEDVYHDKHPARVAYGIFLPL